MYLYAIYSIGSSNAFIVFPSWSQTTEWGNGTLHSAQVSNITR